MAFHLHYRHSNSKYLFSGLFRGTVSKLTSSFPPPTPAYIIANAMAWLESSVIYTERKMAVNSIISLQLGMFTLTSVTYAFVAPNRYPFNTPHKNLATTAQMKFRENPKSSSERTVPHTPNNNTGLRPRRSDTQPQIGLPTRLPTW